MPIREYLCGQCGHKLERLQKHSDAPLTDCPECGAEALTRQISAVGFRLSGGGWYETDFKSDERRNIASDKDQSKDQSKDDSGESKAKDSEGSNAESGSTEGSGKNEKKDESGKSSETTAAKPDKSRDQSGQTSKPAGSTDKNTAAKNNAGKGGSANKSE